MMKKILLVVCLSITFLLSGCYINALGSLPATVFLFQQAAEKTKGHGGFGGGAGFGNYVDRKVLSVQQAQKLRQRCGGKVMPGKINVGRAFFL